MVIPVIDQDCVFTVEHKGQPPVVWSCPDVGAGGTGTKSPATWWVAGRGWL